MPYGRRNYDFSERWFRAENDFLGDPFSSHVNPVFWAFHGWIDDRLNDWYLAHQQAHPGEVKLRMIDGVPWFAPGAGCVWPSLGWGPPVTVAVPGGWAMVAAPGNWTSRP